MFRQVWHGGTLIELINASLKLACVHPTGAALEAKRSFVVGIVPAREPIELELNERDQWGLPKHEIDLVTFDKLLNLVVSA